MKALVLNGCVVEVSPKPFPVHESMVWVDCDETVQAGYTYDGDFHAPHRQKVDIISALEEIDRKSIRALREGNQERLALLEAEAEILRQELKVQV